MTKWLIDFCASVIQALGYPGIFLLMVCESMYVPIPSFAVMPFVGYVAHRVANGDLPSGPGFWLGTAVGAFGGLVGSLLTYWFGWWAGPAGVRRWGRYGGLIEEDLDTTQKYFETWGAPTVFFARFIPVVRHFISTVAGLAHMRIFPFVSMTIAGAFLWDLFLASCGWVLMDGYDVIAKYTKPVDVVVIIIFGGGAIHLFRKLRARVRKRRAEKPTSPAADLDGPKGSP